MGRVTKVRITITGKRPVKLIENPKTWGEYLRNKRLELRFPLRDAAREIGVMEGTLYRWEHDREKIRPMQYPRIIRFLGFIPPLFPMETLGQRITVYRLIHGLSKQVFAGMMRVETETLRKWERDETEPKGEKKERIERLLRSIAR